MLKNETSFFAYFCSLCSIKMIITADRYIKCQNSIITSKENLYKQVAPFVKEIVSSNEGKGRHTTIAVSGSSQPVLLSKLLADVSISWKNVEFYFADERCVPYDHPDSNYYAWSKAFTDARIPQGNIHKANSGATPEESAEMQLRILVFTLRYSSELKSLPVQNSYPVFDIIFLGVGPDGHICSLFPGFPHLKDSTHWVVPVHNSPKPPSDRVSLTLPVVNNASHVFVIATGSSKRSVISSSLQGPNDLPISQVCPTQGNMIWFLDQEATPCFVCEIHSSVSHNILSNPNVYSIPTNSHNYTVFFLKTYNSVPSSIP